MFQKPSHFPSSSSGPGWTSSSPAGLSLGRPAMNHPHSPFVLPPTHSPQLNVSRADHSANMAMRGDHPHTGISLASVNVNTGSWAPTHPRQGPRAVQSTHSPRSHSPVIIPSSLKGGLSGGAPLSPKLSSAPAPPMMQAQPPRRPKATNADRERSASPAQSFGDAA